MKSYLRPYISEANSNVLSSKLQGTGASIICTEDNVPCLRQSSIMCSDAGLTDQWTVLFYGLSESSYESCAIVIGSNRLSNCVISPGPSCESGRLYALSCTNPTSADCLVSITTPISIVCETEEATCRSGR